jgi:hypothetical protein
MQPCQAPRYYRERPIKAEAGLESGAVGFSRRIPWEGQSREGLAQFFMFEFFEIFVCCCVLSGTQKQKVLRKPTACPCGIDYHPLAEAANKEEAESVHPLHESVTLHASACVI